MITKVIIDNFKAIEHLELDLRPFQVFVGPNDSGKSTILQALDLLGRSMTSPIVGSLCLFEDGFDQYLPHGDVARTVRLEARGVCPGGDYRYQIHCAARPAPRLVFEKLVVDGELRFEDHSGNTSALALCARSSPEICDDLHSFTAQFDPKNLAAPAVLGSQIESDGTGLASLVDDLLTAPDRKPLHELEEQLRRFSPFIGGVSTQPTPDKRGKELLYMLAGTQRPVAASQASRALNLVTAYLALRHGTRYRRYLIEQPENGIHPHALRFIVQILRDLTLAGAQVLITTHSPLLLNHMFPEEVTIVTRCSDCGSRATPIVDTRLFAERSRDFDLGELWFNIGEAALVVTS